MRAIATALAALRSELHRRPFLFLVLGAFVITVFLVNPRRETAIDDDWSYALTVRHLVATGTYKLHEWCDANILFQAYWARLFVGVLGYSFASLRLSTLVLTFFGLIGLYWLAREQQFDDTQAGLITLALFASPLFMFTSFTFNSDVPFLMCAVIALAFYARGIRAESFSLMLAASLVASAAVFTRQFGVVLPVSVFVLWMASKEYRGKTFLFLTGLFAPVVASVWQLSSSIRTPTWHQRNSSYAEVLYLADLGGVVRNALWRPSAALHYLALFALPFVALAIIDLALVFRGSGAHPGPVTKVAKGKVLVGAATAAYVLGGIVYGHFGNHLSWFMPYLPWDQTLTGTGPWQRAGWTFVTSVGAVIIAYILVQRYVLDRRSWQEAPVAERLLAIFTVLLFGAHLVYHKLGDRYLLGVLPFVLIVVGDRVRGVLHRFPAAASVICVAMLLTSAMWSRGLLSQAEAKWKAADVVSAGGMEPRRIVGFFEWDSYHGAIEDYLSDIDYVLTGNHIELWERWYPARKNRAWLWITTTPMPDVGTVVYEVPYADSLFRERHIYVINRRASATQARG